MSYDLSGIEFRETGNVPLNALQQLFRKEEWNDFFDLDEVAFYLEKALHVVSAWDHLELVGFARLEGDGRISVEISDVLVRSEYQGQGIGTELVRRLVNRIRQLDPYYIQVTPIGDREVHLYEKFGFREIEGWRQMELPNPKLYRKAAEIRGRTAES